MTKFKEVSQLDENKEILTSENEAENTNTDTTAETTENTTEEKKVLRVVFEF